MPPKKKSDDTAKIMSILKSVPGAKISSIEIEFEDPAEAQSKAEEMDMKDMILAEILKQRKGK